MRPMLIAFDLDGTLVEDHLIEEGQRCPQCGSTLIIPGPRWTCAHDPCGHEFTKPLPPRLRPRTDVEYTRPILIPQAKARLDELTPYANDFAIVTNQGGVALGYQTEDEVKRRISRTLELLDFFSGQSFSIHYCLHHPKGIVPGFQNPTLADLARRKPNSGMLVEAMKPGGWSRSGRCVYIGDRDTDRQAAEGVMHFLDAEQWWSEGIAPAVNV